MRMACCCAGCRASVPEQPQMRSHLPGCTRSQAFAHSRDRHSSGGHFGLALPLWMLVEEARGAKASFEGTAVLQVS